MLRKKKKCIMSEDWLPDQLKTCGNLIEIALLLIEQDKRRLLPTILEILFEEVQHIIEVHCVDSGGR